MSRLHAIFADEKDAVDHFKAEPQPVLEHDDDIVEGARGWVVREVGGRRTLQSMTWGFPRLTRDMRERGAGAERLGLVADLTNPMWEATVADSRYRCLVVLTHFANPDGPRGSKTRTWFSIRDREVLAWAGFCRNTREFGPAYAGMTMPANAAVMPTNNRMPVLLEPGEYDRWLRGSVEDVIRFQFRPPIPAERMKVERSSMLWRSGVRAAPSPQLAML